MQTSNLQHHGVLGQKWGIRRYQNKDGSLTSAGKKRYKDISTWSIEARSASELRKKNINELTNSELRVLNERTRLEREYQKLNPSSVAKGLAFIGSVAAITGSAVALYSNGGKIISVGKNICEMLVDSVGNTLISELNRG